MSEISGKDGLLQPVHVEAPAGHLYIIHNPSPGFQQLFFPVESSAMEDLCQNVKEPLRVVMSELDRWVESHGSGRYIPENFGPTLDRDFALPEDFGVQQVRSEIRDFADLLLRHEKKARALEIGLGYFGSSHFLWRQIFDHVATIEIRRPRIDLFRKNLRAFVGREVFHDGQSAVFIGNSHAPPTVKKVRDGAHGDRFDMLFIDGDHSYEGVMADWLLYSHLVAPGGIVAFHDFHCSQPSVSGVGRFLADLTRGNMDGTKREVSKILHSRNYGIAYYHKE